MDSSSKLDKKRCEELKYASHVKLVESGEVERLKELLRTRLVECGWKDEMRAECKARIRERNIENITVDELITEITPIGRDKVPESVKIELIQRIKMFLEDK